MFFTNVHTLYLCVFQDVTGAYYIMASLGKPSILNAHLSLCPDGMKKEITLDLGGGPEGKDSGSVTCTTTPLGLAVLLDNAKLMEMLLAKGASPNDCSDTGKEETTYLGEPFHRSELGERGRIVPALLVGLGC